MKYTTGALEDIRPKKERKKDWNANEIAGSIPFEWKEKAMLFLFKEWKSYTERNQKGTSSCVPQSISKLLEINEINENDTPVIFSASKAYADRTNSGAGSYLFEMLKYAVENKYTTEERIQSQNLSSDNEMAEKAKKWSKVDEKIAKKYGAKAYLIVDKKIDTIAQWVFQDQAVAILLYFTSAEWGKKYPKIDPNTTRANSYAHCVTVVDFGLIKGKKYLKIEDSAHFGGISERWITEDWIKERCFGAGMIYDKKNEDEAVQPYEFKYNLYYGMRNEPDVAKLQQLLKAQGYFPEAIPCTGNYLTITAQALDKYQRANKVASEWELNMVRGRICGVKTRLSLNNLL